MIATPSYTSTRLIHLFENDALIQWNSELPSHYTFFNEDLLQNEAELHKSC